MTFRPSSGPNGSQASEAVPVSMLSYHRASVPAAALGRHSKCSRFPVTGLPGFLRWTPKATFSEEGSRQPCSVSRAQVGTTCSRWAQLQGEGSEKAKTVFSAFETQP